MIKNKTFAAFLSATGLSAVFRAVQLLFMTEYETGFIMRERAVPFYVFSALIALLFAGCAFFAVSNSPQAKKRKYFYLLTSIASILLGGALVFEVFAGGYTGIPSVVRVLYIAFAALSALYFIAFALRPVIYFPFSAKFSVLPVAFFITKAAAVFIRGSYHAVISDTVLEAGIYCFNLLFFLETARAVNGFGNNKSVKKITVFGILAALFSLTLSVPKIAVSLVYGAALHSGDAGSMLPLFIGLYDACIVFSRVSFSSRESGLFGGRH